MDSEDESGIRFVIDSADEDFSCSDTEAEIDAKREEAAYAAKCAASRRKRKLEKIEAGKGAASAPSMMPSKSFAEIEKPVSKKTALYTAPADISLPLDLSWVDTCTVPSASQYPRRLLVAHLCPGICGGMHAFKFLNVPESVRYLYDIWGALNQPLLYNVPRTDRVHVKCGKKNGGDVTQIDINSLEPVDILKAGPPCTPWSSLGCGLTTEDPRSEVFNAVIKCVVQFGKMGLKVFLLENVLGGLKSWMGRPKFMDELVEHLKIKMSLFVYRVEVTNSKYHGLPQNRARVFLIGYHAHFVPSAPSLDQPSFAPMAQASLYNLLAKGCPKLDVMEHLTAKERECVLHGYIPLLQEKLWCENCKGKAAIFDITRNPEKIWSLLSRRRSDNDFDLWECSFGCRQLGGGNGLPEWTASNRSGQQA